MICKAIEVSKANFDSFSYESGFNVTLPALHGNLNDVLVALKEWEMYVL